MGIKLALVFSLETLDARDYGAASSKFWENMNLSLEIYIM